MSSLASHPNPTSSSSSSSPPTKQQAYQLSCQAARQLASSLPPAPLPSLTHFTLSDYENFYEPSDDTFLLVDALSHDVPLTLSQRPASSPPDLRGVEIGSGSGVNVVTLGSLLASHLAATACDVQATCFATDVNPKAVDATLRTIAANNGRHDLSDGTSSSASSSSSSLPPVVFHVASCDLLGVGSEPWWSSGGVDFLLFNPPYVPTPDEEVEESLIAKSWAGGRLGRVVLDRAAPDIARVLRPGGVAYIIAVDDNRPMDIIEYFERGYGLLGKVLLRRQAKNEFLSVLRFLKPLQADGDAAQSCTNLN